jgi:hypothetical protein
MAFLLERKGGSFVPRFNIWRVFEMRILQQIVAVLVLALLVAGQACAQAELKPGIGITFSDVSKNPVNGEVTSQLGWHC